MKHLKTSLIAVMLLTAAAALAQPRLAALALGTNLSSSKFKSTHMLGAGLEAGLVLDNNVVFTVGYTAAEQITWTVFAPTVPGTYLQTMKTTNFLAGYRFAYSPKLVFDCMGGLALSTYEERVIYGSVTEPNGWFPIVHPLSYNQTITQVAPDLRARANWLFTRYTGLHVECGALIHKSTATYLQVGLTFGKLR